MNGDDLRDAGIEAVLAADVALNRNYAELVDQAIDAFVEAGMTFSADDIRDWIERHHPEAEAHSHNVLPGAFGRASRAGRIEPVGFTKPTRASRHGNRNLVWRAAA